MQQYKNLLDLWTTGLGMVYTGGYDVCGLVFERKGLMSVEDKFAFYRTSNTVWTTAKAHRGYTATITYVAGTGYSLLITGSGAPGAANYLTLRNAKNAFRKFLSTKPVA